MYTASSLRCINGPMRIRPTLQNRRSYIARLVRQGRRIAMTAMLPLENIRCAARIQELKRRAVKQAVGTSRYKSSAKPYLHLTVAPASLSPT
jgi:hypothetical protein